MMMMMMMMMMMVMMMIMMVMMVMMMMMMVMMLIVLQLAMQELLRVNEYVAPKDKVYTPSVTTLNPYRYNLKPLAIQP